MKIHATRGDVYVFAESPTVRFLIECAQCDNEPWRPHGQREFTNPEARAAWIAEHAETWPEHAVVSTTEVSST